MPNTQNLRPKTAFPHSQTNGTTIKGSSLAWKLLRRNSVNPEKKVIDQILGGFKLESRPYVLNPKYSTPTSLPLYFYFGYQILQESNLMEDCGPVSLLFLNIHTTKTSNLNDFSGTKKNKSSCYLLYMIFI